MDCEAPASHARRMEQPRSLPPPAEALLASSHELQRAAGAIQKHARAFGEVTVSPFTLVHIEEALDRLYSALHMMADATEERPQSGADEALRRHLTETARAIHAANLACGASRQWARKRAAVATGTPSSEVAAPELDSIELYRFDDPVAGSQVLTATIDELTLTYDVHAIGQDSTRRVRSHVSSLQEARRWAKAYATNASAAAA